MGSPGPTTEAGMFAAVNGASGPRVQLLGVEVKAEVCAATARATMRQRYRNDGPRAIEAVYTFPLPSNAVLTAFAMIVDGRTIAAEVVEREAAFKKYEDAITAGHGAALVERERANVFTASLGNLLPGEETIIELEWLEPLRSEEGTLRYCLPTLVAPRYIPDELRVPDADRISPPRTTSMLYGLAFELTLDLGVALEVTSPSHAVTVSREGNKCHVTFVQPEVPLDRDIVINASSVAQATAAPFALVRAHQREGGEGAFALTLVPDLGHVEPRTNNARNDVVFLLDRSGSMGGAAMEEARNALRLCLRQLREGDRFDILAFDDVTEPFAPTMVPFTQATLQRADAWLAHIEARGGTELLGPLVDAARFAPDGVLIILTDGQVGNEEEILRVFMDARRSARVHAFGIGTNVSDALLLDLANRTGGGLEMIHPGERVDTKVVAQFARATARRVTDLAIGFRGIVVSELAPAHPVALVDGEPFSLFGRFERKDRGAIEIRGTLDGERFYLEVPVDLLEASDRPVIEKLWAQARITDLESVSLHGRRAETMTERIIALAKEHGVSSKYTSFVVVEKRTGARRTNLPPETQTVPVTVPAGWAMFQGTQVMACKTRVGTLRRSTTSTRSGAAGPPPPARVTGKMISLSSPVVPSFEQDEVRAGRLGIAPRAPAARGLSPGEELLTKQAASGLWEKTGAGVLQPTVEALLLLLREGITSSHPVHGAQMKKAVDALVAQVDAGARTEDRVLVEAALGVAWLAASGPRTRRTIEALVRRESIATLVALLPNDAHVLARVEALARSC